MGADNLYSIRGNALDIRGGCALDGMSIPCSELQERMERRWVEMEYMYPAVAPGQPHLNSPGQPVTILRTERFPILSLGLGMFMTAFPARAGGPVGAGNNNEGYYLSWRDDVFRFAPQNSQPLPSDLKDRVANIVNNPKTDCAEFIKILLGNANEKAFSDDPIKLFERVESEKGFRLGNTGKYGGLAAMTGGKREIILRPVNATNDPRLSEHQAYAYAVRALN